jgi:hypothetical protein
MEVLIERLEQEYGPDYPVVHYIAAVLPTEDAVMDKFTISQLHDPEVARRVTGISTFYLPPKELREPNVEMLKKLRLPVKLTDIRHQFYPSNQWSPPKTDSDVAPYGPYEQAAISKLDGHTTPEQYSPLVASKAMIDLMTKLALDPRLLAEYKADPHAFVQAMPDLSDSERDALEKGTLWAVQGAMKDLSTLDMKDSEQGRPNSAATTVFIIDIVVVVSINDMTGAV